jgi:hypothetical protein
MAPATGRASPGALPPSTRTNLARAFIQSNKSSCSCSPRHHLCSHIRWGNVPVVALHHPLPYLRLAAAAPTPRRCAEPVDPLTATDPVAGRAPSRRPQQREPAAAHQSRRPPLSQVRQHHHGAAAHPQGRRPPHDHGAAPGGGPRHHDVAPPSRRGTSAAPKRHRRWPGDAISLAFMLGEIQRIVNEF